VRIAQYTSIAFAETLVLEGIAGRRLNHEAGIKPVTVQIEVVIRSGFDSRLALA
jgi:hypothetical protein